MAVAYQARATSPDDIGAGHMPYQVLADGAVIAEFAQANDATIFMQEKFAGTQP